LTFKIFIAKIILWTLHQTRVIKQVFAFAWKTSCGIVLTCCTVAWTRTTVNIRVRQICAIGT